MPNCRNCSTRISSTELNVGDKFIYLHQNQYLVIYLSKRFVIALHLIDERVIRLSRDTQNAPDYVLLISRQVERRLPISL